MYLLPWIHQVHKVYKLHQLPQVHRVDQEHHYSHEKIQICGGSIFKNQSFPGRFHCDQQKTLWDHKYVWSRTFVSFLRIKEDLRQTHRFQDADPRTIH